MMLGRSYRYLEAQRRTIDQRYLAFDSFFIGQSRPVYLNYLVLPNFSCHLPRPLAGAVAASLLASGTSSMVSWTVAMALRPTAMSEPSDVVATGASKISALDVFFCRNEKVLSPVLRSAAVGELVRVSLRLWGAYMLG
jgi:hypothetical protein